MENKLIKKSDNLFLVEKFWDEEICNTIISLVEKDNVLPSEETVKDQITLDDNLDSRNDFMLYLQNEDLANIIFQSLSPFFKDICFDNIVPTGVHQDLRVYKYLPKQEFKRHRDGERVVSDYEKSYFSLLIYLNDNYEGGTTLFDNCEIFPKTGLACFFPHKLEHSGTIVNSGNKFILRGNILFKKL